MKAYFLKYMAVYTSLIVCSFICSQGWAAQFELNVSTDSDVRTPGTDKRERVLANQPKSFSFDEALWIESENRIPVLVVPAGAKNSQLKIDAPETTRVVQQLGEKQMSAMLSDLMTEIADIQKLIRSKQLSESRTRLTRLMARYPNVSFLKFVLASQLLLEGEKAQALRTAEEALKSNPDYIEGKSFIASLKGNRQ